MKKIASKRSLYVFLALLPLLAASCSKTSDIKPQTSSPTTSQTASESQKQEQSAPTPTKPDASQTTTTKPKTANSSPQTPGTYTFAQIQEANNQSKCWTVINGNVYNLTSFFTKHPGGAQAILRLCGTDGTNEYNKQHGSEQKPEQTLAGLKIGTLAK